MGGMQTAAFGVPEYDPERVGVYRPRIKPEHLRWLWVLKQRTGQPITALVAEAIESYLAHQKGGDKDGQTKMAADVARTQTSVSE
jgi:hypothetical protein